MFPNPPRSSPSSTPATVALVLVVTGMLAPFPLSSAGGDNVFSAYFQRLSRERRARRRGGPTPHHDHQRSPGMESLSPGLEPLSPADVFIAVKSTDRFHRSRLELLMDTWMSKSKEQTFVFTDAEDPRLRDRLGDHLINTNCSRVHSRQALSCKMSQEIQTFLNTDRKWFCHVDDDNYVNTGALLKLLSRYHSGQDVYIGRPSTGRPIRTTYTTEDAGTQQGEFWFATGGAGFCLSYSLVLKMEPWISDGAFMATSEMIRLPDDCTVGFIVEALLGVGLIRCPLFHSHLETLGLLTDLTSQVTLSYSLSENHRNTVHLRGIFSSRQDPTRFRSLHCLLYPDTSWCPSVS